MLFNVYKATIKELAIKIQMSKARLIENGFSYKEGALEFANVFHLFLLILYLQQSLKRVNGYTLFTL